MSFNASSGLGVSSNWFRLADARILIADSLPKSRETTRKTLQDLGVGGFTLTESIPETREHLAEGGFDLLISDSHLRDEGAASAISDVRQIRLGGDPFIPVVALTWEPNIETVQELVNAGIDQMLTLPVSKDHLIRTLEAIIEKRKPFVVTSDYIGPDRRKNPRLSLHQVPQIKAPNALRYKATGDDDGISREEVLQAVHDQRAERQAARIVYTVGKIAGLISGKNEGTMETWLAEIRNVVAELNASISETRYQHHTMLCRSLLDVVDRIQGTGSPASSELEIMQQLALAIEIGFNRNDTSSVDAALDISEMVGCSNAA